MTRAQRRWLRWRCLVRSWAGALLDALYPRDCVCCGLSAERGYLCRACRLALFARKRNNACTRCGEEAPAQAGEAPFRCLACQARQPAFVRAAIALRYAGEVRQMIHAFKYHRGLWLAEELAGVLLACFRRSFAGLAFDGVVPVPMTRRKLRERGYNQAEVLAKRLARRLALPCRCHLLQRVETGIPSQTHLRRSQRLHNAHEAYQLVPGAPPLCGLRLLLVDDVITTGATAEACARRLRQAGASEVYVLALARPMR